VSEQTGPRSLEAPADEVSALIHTLHHSLQRLEEMTFGEVDAVVGPEGQTYLLGRA
jgi:hypothetical protein